MGLQTLNNSEMLTAASVDEQLKCHACSAGANGGPGEPAPTRKIGHLGRRCGQGFSYSIARYVPPKTLFPPPTC